MLDRRSIVREGGGVVMRSTARVMAARQDHITHTYFVRNRCSYKVQTIHTRSSTWVCLTPGRARARTSGHRPAPSIASMGQRGHLQKFKPLAFICGNPRHLNGINKTPLTDFMRRRRPNAHHTRRTSHAAHLHAARAELAACVKANVRVRTDATDLH